MPRVGLSKQRVVDAAAHLVDTEGVAALSVARLASELGVRPPSLYKHIRGLEELHRELGLRAADALAAACRDAAMGRARLDALLAVAEAFRRVAREHSGSYSFAQVVRSEDEEWQQRTWAGVEPVLAILAGYGLDREASIHAARSLRAGLFGFVTLELAGGFGLPEDLDESYRYFVVTFEAGLRAGLEPGDSLES